MYSSPTFYACVTDIIEIIPHIRTLLLLLATYMHVIGWLCNCTAGALIATANVSDKVKDRPTILKFLDLPL